MLIQKPLSWLELNSKAFEHNINLYKNLVGPNTIISVVVKSNAYGHGLKEVGMLCQKNAQVDWLCTAMLSEALLLRSLGITKPILVLSIIDEDPLLAAHHNIDLPIVDRTTLNQVAYIAQLHKKTITVHLKIDTGIARFGFDVDTAFDDIIYATSLPYITVHGIFTHCAESGNNDTSYTQYQLERFNALCQRLTDNGIVISHRHGANSAATRIHTQFPLFNFIRLGAGAYGLWHLKNKPEDHPEIALQPVLSWKTTVAHIKTVPANTFVGYDRTYTTTRETTLVTLPLGYFEGYDRRFTNQGIVRIRDYYAPVVGRICMNAIIVAIPAHCQVDLGDEVLLLGDYPGIKAHELAHTIGSFNAREITTRLNPNLERRVVEHEIRVPQNTNPFPLLNPLDQSIDKNHEI